METIQLVQLCASVRWNHSVVMSPGLNKEHAREESNQAIKKWNE